jgi:hypothetical protein
LAARETIRLATASKLWSPSLNPGNLVLQFFFWLLLFVLVAGGWLVWSQLRRTLFSRRVERALRDIVRDRNELQATFLRTAGASGKPRGLAWKQCDFQDGLLLARDRATGELIGLVGATISFAAIEGVATWKTSKRSAISCRHRRADLEERPMDHARPRSSTSNRARSSSGTAITSTRFNRGACSALFHARR